MVKLLLYLGTMPQRYIGASRLFSMHFGFGLRERIRIGFKIPFHSEESVYVLLAQET